MKTFLFAAALAIPASALAAPPVQAPVQAPAKAAQAPTQAPVQAPGGKMAAAPATGDYRTFSLEPGLAPMPASFNAMNFSGGGMRSRARTSGFHDAGFKVRGGW